MSNFAKGVGVVLLLAVALAGLYLGGWWVKRDSVNRQSVINTESYARQQALAQEAIDLHTEVTRLDVRALDAETDQEKTVLGAQRAALVTEFCDAYYQVTVLNAVGPDLVIFASKEC